MRINKFFTENGICSRRDADAMIAAGRVTIDGRTAKLGDRVDDTSEVRVDQKRLKHGRKKEIILAYNKPVGIVCTTDPRDEDNIIDALNYPDRVFPIGRLDQMSEGLILLTNMGDIVNRILRSRFANEKEYIVDGDDLLTDEMLREMASGLMILGERTLPCKIERLGAKRIRMTLTQGRNRQIRRMFEAVGRKVTRLKRVRVMNVELGDLPSGKWRELSDRESSMLLDELRTKTLSG